MRLISGLESPSGGKIILDDKDMTYSEIREVRLGDECAASGVWA